MTVNLYDVLYAPPKLHKKLKKPQERLAQALVAAGRLRLDADNESNFIRLLLPQEAVNLTFSYRELYEPALVTRSRDTLLRAFSKRHDTSKATAMASYYFDQLRAAIRKKSPVQPRTELMVARALVLCNALPVIRLIHAEGAEIFISFGHSVGDVMDIARWQQVGENSGLQAAGGGENAIYVSCGGHPLLDDDERTYSSDGFPALARLMIIAAQETGHNGDMIRTSHGRWAGRHSAINWGDAPSAKAGNGRKADIARLHQLYRLCQRMGMQPMMEWERHLKFYRTNKLFNMRRLLAWLASKLGWQLFKLLLAFRGAGNVASLQRDPYPATLLSRFFPDMLFNVAPIADVYRRANPTEEEAIACIEAVARVPQQVVKWGHRAVQFCTPSLYALYYQEIVPACERALMR